MSSKQDAEKDSRKASRSLVAYLLIGGLMILAHPFLWSQVAAMAERWQDQRLQSDQVAEVRSRIEVVEETYAVQQAQLGELTSLLPPRGETVQFIERVESLARQRGLSAQIATIEEGELRKDEEDKKSSKVLEEDEPLVIPLVISVSVIGEPAQLLSYLDAIEHVPELAEIDSLSLAPYLPPQGEEVVVIQGSSILTFDIWFYVKNDG